MKRNLLLLALALLCLLSTRLYSQTPSTFKYQGLLKNADNTAVSSTPIEVELSLHVDGNIAYIELHNIDTSPDGIFSINIGDGQVVSGNFDGIDWRNGVAMDIIIDGEIFEESYALQAVPYAMYALSSGGATGGEQGPQGEPGPEGAQGPPGEVGPEGPQGEVGPAGSGVSIVGSVDSAGLLDPAYDGEIGDMFISQDNGNGHVWNGSSFDDVGPIRGPEGPVGPAGEIGPAGEDGMQGPQGETGPAGSGVTIVGSVDNDGLLDLKALSTE